MFMFDLLLVSCYLCLMCVVPLFGGVKYVGGPICSPE